jgi:hypothetical protein
VIRFAGEHCGAAGTTNTLFAPGPDAGQNLADGLQEGPVSGYVDDAPGAA